MSWCSPSDFPSHRSTMPPDRPTQQSLRKHILPFAIAPLIVQFAIAAPLAVIAEASLSFLGLGTQPPSPSLGLIISDAQQYFYQSSSGIVFPVVTVALLVLCLTLIADGLQDMIDPRRQAAMA